MSGTVDTYFRDLQTRAVGEFTRALDETAREGVRLGQDLSKGPYTQALLTAMGHPYAKRRPRPPLPTAIINYQTGNFYRAWAARNAVLRSGLLSAFVLNASPEATDLDRGTMWAIRRPIGETIENVLPTILQKQVMDAVRRL